MKSDFFLEAMHRRYACKLFDVNYTLSAAEIDCIIEYGRLSPSSFGLEPWHFYVVESAAKKKELCSACFNQEAVGTASVGVAILSRRAPWFDPDGEFIAERGLRFPGALADFIEDYRGYYDWLKENGLIDSWSKSQCYIACANMMTGAAGRGIESCAIEGFNNALILDMLGLDPVLWQTGIVCVFGKAARSDERSKIRMNPEKVCTHV